MRGFRDKPKQRQTTAESPGSVRGRRETVCAGPGESRQNETSLGDHAVNVNPLCYSCHHEQPFQMTPRGLLPVELTPLRKPLHSPALPATAPSLGDSPDRGVTLSHRFARRSSRAAKATGRHMNGLVWKPPPGGRPAWHWQDDPPRPRVDPPRSTRVRRVQPVAGGARRPRRRKRGSCRSLQGAPAEATRQSPRPPSHQARDHPCAAAGRRAVRSPRDAAKAPAS